MHEAIAQGTFGPLDVERAYASGLSSGGYMTSRMAVSYPGQFKALAIHAASYATCLGAACVVPGLPSDHPPTAFFHGDDDTTAPLWAAKAYEKALSDQGTATQFTTEANIGHAWLAAAVDGQTAWFNANP
jgi:poly(3-hydroxybutyrate) depolymerase